MTEPKDHCLFFGCGRLTGHRTGYCIHHRTFRCIRCDKEFISMDAVHIAGKRQYQFCPECKLRMRKSARAEQPKVYDELSSM